MFALSTPKSGRFRKLACRALRDVRRVAGWAALVAAALTLFTFVTIKPSQACPERNNRAPHSTQHVAKSIAKQSVAVSPLVKFVFKGGGCCGDGSGHCHGRCARCGLDHCSDSHSAFGFSASTNTCTFNRIRQSVSTSPNHSLIKFPIEYAIACFRGRVALDREALRRGIRFSNPPLRRDVSSTHFGGRENAKLDESSEKYPPPSSGQSAAWGWLRH